MFSACKYGLKVAKIQKSGGKIGGEVRKNKLLAISRARGVCFYFEKVYFSGANIHFSY